MLTMNFYINNFLFIADINKIKAIINYILFNTKKVTGHYERNSCGGPNIKHDILSFNENNLTSIHGSRNSNVGFDENYLLYFQLKSESRLLAIDPKLQTEKI